MVIKVSQYLRLPGRVLVLRVLGGSSVGVVLLLASLHLHLLLELLPLLLQGHWAQLLVAGLTAVVAGCWLEGLLLLFSFLSLPYNANIVAKT